MSHIGIIQIMPYVSEMKKPAEKDRSNPNLLKSHTMCACAYSHLIYWINK